MKEASPLEKMRADYVPELPPLLQNLSSAAFSEEPASVHDPDSELQEFFPEVSKSPLLRAVFPMPSGINRPQRASNKNFSSEIAVPSSSFPPSASSSSMDSTLRGGRGEGLPAAPLKVGIVLSGGQSPGGHNVISGLFDALKKLHSESCLIGFLNGVGGVIQDLFVELDEARIAPYRNSGGFDLLGGGRTKMETTEQFERVAQTLKRHQLDGLVIVGGDDSNTNAAFLAEFCRRQGLPTRIIGVPKTIDGDLKNDFIELSFGFDTASKIYAEIVGNLLRDALSAKKYYFFVKMMGRSASHLTLECALQTHVNLALIGEEIAAGEQTLDAVVQQVADLIGERARSGKNFGVVLIPEGLLEFIPECCRMIGELNGFLADPALPVEEAKWEEEALRTLSAPSARCFSSLPKAIRRQLLLDRDPHGNVQLSKIETERLIIELVEEELQRRRERGEYVGIFNPQPFFCGYEGRCGFPSNFDCDYCYALGHTAALLVRHSASGYLCCIKHLVQSAEHWEVWGIPIATLLHFECRKNKKQAVIKKARVDLKAAPFTSFRDQRESWRLGDLYRFPGPIQFCGPHELVDSRPITLQLSHLQPL